MVSSPSLPKMKSLPGGAGLEDRVVVEAADQGVIPASTVDRIEPTIAEDDVVAGAGKQGIVAVSGVVAAGQGYVSGRGSPAEGVVALVSEKLTAPGILQDGIIARPRKIVSEPP